MPDAWEIPHRHMENKGISSRVRDRCTCRPRNTHVQKHEAVPGPSVLRKIAACLGSESEESELEEEDRRLLGKDFVCL